MRNYQNRFLVQEKNRNRECEYNEYINFRDLFKYRHYIDVNRVYPVYIRKEKNLMFLDGIEYTKDISYYNKSVQKCKLICINHGVKTQDLFCDLEMIQGRFGPEKDYSMINQIIFYEQGCHLVIIKKERYTKKDYSYDTKVSCKLYKDKHVVNEGVYIKDDYKNNTLWISDNIEEAEFIDIKEDKITFYEFTYDDNDYKELQERFTVSFLN